MAIRYAVATGNWSSTAVWSDSDGGSAGFSAPVAGDTAYLTATSGAITVTVSATAASAVLDCTGYTGTLVMSAGLTLTSDITFSATMTISGTATITANTGGTITGNGVSGASWSGQLAISSAHTLNTNGTTWASVNFGSSATYTLLSGFQCTALTFNNTNSPTFAGAFDVTCATLTYGGGTGTMTLVAGQKLIITSSWVHGQASAVMSIVSATPSSPTYIQYTGAAADLKVFRVAFTDVDFSTNSTPVTNLDNWYGSTLTRTSGITNRTSADIGGGSGAGAWAHRMIGGGF